MALTDKEIIELRIKCLTPYVAVASKHDLERDVVIKKAELAWEYATAGLTSGSKSKPEKSTGSDSK